MSSDPQPARGNPNPEGEVASQREAISGLLAFTGLLSVETIRDLVLKHALTRSGEKVTPREAVTTAQAIHDACRTQRADVSGLVEALELAELWLAPVGVPIEVISIIESALSQAKQVKP